MDGKNAFIDEQGIEEAVERAIADEERPFGDICDIARMICAATEDGPEFEGRTDALAALAAPDLFMVSCLFIILQNGLDPSTMRISRYAHSNSRAEAHFETGGMCFALVGDFDGESCFVGYENVFGVRKSTLLAAMLPSHGYRYVFSGGLFASVDGVEKFVNLSLPTPFIYRSEAEAMGDTTAYRIMGFDGNVVLAAFPSESFKVDESDPEKALLVWTEGRLLRTYTYEQFVDAGGEIICFEDDDSVTELTKDFRSLFPQVGHGDCAYVDNEAYCIEEV